MRLKCQGFRRYLAENEENRRKIRDAGGIPPLAKSFIAAWTEAPEIQELSCKCLLNLSITPGAAHILEFEPDSLCGDNARLASHVQSNPANWPFALLY